MLFISGATGSVGVEIIRLLIGRRYSEPVRMLIRADSAEALNQRWAKLLAIASCGDLRPEDLPQFVPLSGDVTRTDLGLTPAQRDELRASATAALHVAANVNFDDPLDVCRRIN